jgi:hypothetical protein
MPNMQYDHDYCNIIFMVFSVAKRAHKTSPVVFIFIYLYIEMGFELRKMQLNHSNRLIANIYFHSPLFSVGFVLLNL